MAEFTARRNALARAARADKDRELASAIAAFKRPSVALWLANHLARERGLAVSRLLGTARDLAEAQERALAGVEGAGERLRRDSGEYQRALDRAVREAGPLLAVAGHGGGEETLRRVRDVLGNAARGPAAVQDQLARGTLVTEPPVPEFGSFGGAVSTRLQPPQAATRKTGASKSRRAEDDELAARRRQRVATVRREADGAEEALKRAEQAARRLRRRAEAAAAEAHSAEEQAVAAEAAVESARAAADAARRQLAGAT